MRKNIRIFSLLFALLMLVTLFAGCNNDTKPSTSGTPGSSAAPGTSSTPTEEPGEDYVYKMPIADSPYTVGAWRAYTSTLITSPNEILANIELEKRTNIHIDYKLAPQADAVTQYNLLITSGDYPELLFQGINGGTPAYSGGIDKGISDGILLEMTDAINKWMPNLKAYMDGDETIRKQMHTDEGNISAINVIQNGNQPAWVGPGIRVDLLNEVGITKVPETYDDLYTALTKFRDELNVEQPLAINYTGYNTMSFGMISGFDIAPTFYNENGTVKFGFLEAGFVDYLTLMNQWYSEKLIDQDFFTRSTPDDFTAMDRIPSGKIGATEQLIYTLPHIYKALSGSDTFHMKAMPLPRKNASDVAHFRRFNEITGTTAIAVTTAVDSADALEKIARWIDYRFSEEGGRLLNYGIEGDTYTMVNGIPVYTDVILADSEGRSTADMMNISFDSGHGGLYDWTRERPTVSDEEWEAYDIWGKSASGDWNMPPVTMTSDEGLEYSNLYSDIDTLITESIPQFITGAKPLSEYEAFANQIRNMSIDRCIEIQQDALDRYLAR